MHHPHDQNATDTNAVVIDSELEMVIHSDECSTESLKGVILLTRAMNATEYPRPMQINAI